MDIIGFMIVISVRTAISDMRVRRIMAFVSVSSEMVNVTNVKH